MDCEPISGNEIIKSSGNFAWKIKYPKFGWNVLWKFHEKNTKVHALFFEIFYAFLLQNASAKICQNTFYRLFQEKLST